MIVTDNEFKDYNEKVYGNEAESVNYKVILRVELKKQMSKDFLKSLIRGIFYESNIPIRFRVDVGEDSWIDKNNLMGETLVVVRLNDKIKNILDDLSETVKNMNVESLISIKGTETFKVDEFRTVTDKFDRALYGIKLDIKEDVIHDFSQSFGGWVQKVKKWDGTVEDKKVEGAVSVKLKRMESKSPVYKVLVDAPYGLDIYRILEQEFSLKKNSLDEYPIQGIRLYESVDPKKSYLNRKKCPVFGDPIELTVGGLVADKSIKALMGLDPEEINK